MRDGCGGMRVAGARRLSLTCRTCRTCRAKWGRLGIPRGFAGALGGVARGEDVPLSSACLMAAGVCVLRGCDACLWT